jgi:hypothetical protein
MRRRLTWLVAVPLTLAGSQAAHALAYRIVFPQSSLRLHVLAATGHGYLARLPLVLALAGAAGLVGLAAAVADAARGRRVHDLPAPAFAVLPPLAFALQEVLELSLHTGTLGWRAVLAPTFLPGLALQLPFALAAYAAARLLLRAAVRLGRLLAARPRLVAFAPPLPRDAVAGHGFAGRACSTRGPPLAAGI